MVKVPSERINLVIPFDKRLPNISHILHHRWQCLVQRDPLVKEYLPSPLRVAYSRTKSLRDVLVRSKVPPSSYRQSRRQACLGFKKCGGRVDCSVCPHSNNTTSHTCNTTGKSYDITSSVSCLTPWVVYTVTCGKQSGECGQLGPQYVGCTERVGKVRFSEHVGSATQPSQATTTKPVGEHFRLPGHSHANIVFLPIEQVRVKDKFVLEARESF